MDRYSNKTVKMYNDVAELAQIFGILMPTLKDQIKAPVPKSDGKGFDKGLNEGRNEAFTSGREHENTDQTSKKNEKNKPAFKVKKSDSIDIPALIYGESVIFREAVKSETRKGRIKTGKHKGEVYEMKK